MSSFAERFGNITVGQALEMNEAHLKSQAQKLLDLIKEASKLED